MYSPTYIYVGKYIFIMKAFRTFLNFCHYNYAEVLRNYKIFYHFAAQPGVGRVQVLGNKKTEEEEDEEQFFGHDRLT